MARKLKRYINEKIMGVDANDVASVTDWFDLGGCEVVTYFIEPVSGDHANHEFVLDISPDGVYARVFPESKVARNGFLKKNGLVGFSNIRARCLTAEGTASVVNIYIQGFREITR